MSLDKSTTDSFFNKDLSLFLRLKKFKDKQAFLTAYDKYAEAIYRFIYFKIGQEEDARDLTSAVFLKCWSYVQEGKLNEDNEYQSLKAFLYKIARNLVIDYYRQSKPNVSLDEAETIIDDSQDLTQIDTDISLDQIRVKLMYLKDEYKTMIIMRYINELSIAEISQITGKSKGNVRIMVMRALKILKNLLEQSDERPGTVESIK
jgi:RNA polymerase sigma-70 factor (ECF subfamily)